jgi:hypothetical protein
MRYIENSEGSSLYLVFAEDENYGKFTHVTVRMPVEFQTMPGTGFVISRATRHQQSIKRNLTRNSE